MGQAGSEQHEADGGRWTEVAVVSIEGGYLLVADSGAEPALLDIHATKPFDQWDDAVAELGGSYLPTGGDGDFGIDCAGGPTPGTVEFRVDTYGPVDHLPGDWQTQRLIPVPSGQMLFGDLALLRAGHRALIDVPPGPYLLQFFREGPSEASTGMTLGIRLIGPAPDAADGMETVA